MRNLELYGFSKVNKEANERVFSIGLLDSEGEKAARMMAWQCFAEDRVKIDDRNELTAKIARIKYAEALAIFEEAGVEMDIDINDFTSFFFDELIVLSRRVTQKSVQYAFYFLLALGVFGIYKLFF
ncbi:hypothetical protein I9018_15785 [Pseudomonas sp. MPFS]|uniref:hypothetical protein n=1 Tax=Pseudomonas sp. MPFS TaxID=2795724 RepID=UPI001F13867A|nr:hypothetical protein [Pseudomonas sp. MPFS]UMZ15068.1 hypothetical protein I9018_15785 [Pseudomonas sp. MPFS]